MKQFKAIRENIEEDYKKVIKMYPRDKDWKTLVTRHKKAIDDFRKKSKPLPDDVEDELLSWAKEYGLIDARPDEVEFISSILDEETVEEAKKIQDIARKYKRELQKAVKTGQLELSDKATRELERWAVDAGEIRGKEEDEFIDWLDKNLDDLASGKLREGRYTANDGGAFDGLRIAKYLAHEDGKSWRKLKYGETEGYLKDASDLLKNNKSKARSILAKPTPRD
mgnify:CR=1 FL=1